MGNPFVQRLRDRDTLIGYWSVLDSPVSTERIARVGYDYVAIDVQHGLVDYRGMLHGLLAIDAGGSIRRTPVDAAPTVGLVRVESNNATAIGKAFDAGAAGVIVPLVDSPEDAARAVSASRYPPVGIRSYGPMRSGLRVGPVPADAHQQTAVLAMIETRDALENVVDICRVDGLTGVYVGPSYLSLAIGGAFPGDPAVSVEFEEALAAVSSAAADAGIAAGIHCPDGHTAHKRLKQGFTFASIASDLTHLEIVAASHLEIARG